MNDTKYTPVLVSYSLRNSKQPGFCQNSQVPRPLRITRLSEPFVGFGLFGKQAKSSNSLVNLRGLGKWLFGAKTRLLAVP